jgi:uncharacterized protein (DUF433 family)
MDLSHFITVEPGKRSGQPCVRGMRITVRDVLEYLAGGMTIDELLADFPELASEGRLDANVRTGGFTLARQNETQSVCK